MGSYDFATAGKFVKSGWPFLTPFLRIWLFSGLDLAPWQEVDLATLIRTEANFVRIRTGSDCNFFENWRIRTVSD